MNQNCALNRASEIYAHFVGDDVNELSSHKYKRRTINKLPNITKYLAKNLFS